MPTVSVGRDRLFAALGRVYTQEEFEALCFDFGIELDDVTTEKAIIRKEKHLGEDSEADGDDEVIYKIEVAANRYDLLCLEGIARSLRIFTGTEATPIFKISSPGSVLKMKVTQKEKAPYVAKADKLKAEYTKKIRPLPRPPRPEAGADRPYAHEPGGAADLRPLPLRPRRQES